MKSTNTRKKRYANSYHKGNSESNKLFLIPLIFIVSILPFIMHSYQFDTGLGQFSWFSDDDIKVDIFLFYKQIYLLIACSIMLLFIAYNVVKKKIKLSIIPTFIPIFIYGLLALFSTIFSDYPQYGIKGIYEQFESVFVLLGYCLIVYYAFLFIKTENDVRLLLKYLLYSILIFSALGLLQILALDPIVSDFGKKLYLGREYWDYLDKFNLTFPAHRVYLTFYNPNYVGSYTSLLLPVLLALIITEKELKKKMIYLLGFLGLTLCLIGSQSKTGMVAVIVTLILFLFFFRKYIFKNKKITLSVFGICAAGILIVTFTNIDKINKFTDSIFHLQKSTPSLSEIQTEDELKVTYKGEDIKISLENEDNSIYILITDKDNTPLPYSISENGAYILNDSKFSGIKVSPVVYDNLLCIDVKISDKEWVFTNQLGDNTYYYLNSVGKFDKINTADSSIFTGYESLATGRGYIWSRTIPLLKNHILLGSGADSYIYAFPQQDYVGLYNSGFDGQVLTRPHNLYLQIGVQTGVLSLIAFLIFYFMYFVNSVRIYRNGIFDSFSHYIGASIFLGTIGYMITGISNDSTITVAPVFWVLIGVGIAINHTIKVKNQDTQKTS